jgi:hypothetical protein
MKTPALSTALVALLVTSAARSSPLTQSGAVIIQGSHVCLRTDHILGRTILDNSTIVFRLSDGTYWKNTLQAPCVGLAINDGFSFATMDNTICSNQQPIRVVGQHNICFLGNFTQTVSPVKPATTQ